MSGLGRAAQVLEHLLKMARSRVEAYPARSAWTEPPPPEGAEEETHGVAVPGGPVR